MGNLRPHTGPRRGFHNDVRDHLGDVRGREQWCLSDRQQGGPGALRLMRDHLPLQLALLRHFLDEHLRGWCYRSNTENTWFSGGLASERKDGKARAILTII